MVDLQITIPDGFFEEETRCGFLVKKEIKELWAVELDLMAQIDKICRRHNIEYMACGGTLLGAVRHGGFIPWDDDIDLMMTYENYKKLSEVGPSEFKAPYFFQTNQTDPGSIRGHIQIRNSDTTGIIPSEKERKYLFNQGIFVDIFCLDRIPDDPAERTAYIEELKKRRLEVERAAFYTNRYTAGSRKESQGIQRILKDVTHVVSRLSNREKTAYEKYERCLHSHNGEETAEMGITCLPQWGDKLFWKSEDVLSGLKEVPFEFLTIPVPNNYDSMLTKQYGEWRKFVKAPSYHGTLFFDVNQSYRNYIKSE